MACTIWNLSAPTTSGEESIVNYNDCDLNPQEIIIWYGNNVEPFCAYSIISSSLGPGSSLTDTYVPCFGSTPTPTPTPTQTPTNTGTPTQTPTQTPTPTNTGTPTQTPSSPPIICGLGLTTGTYYYTNCCNNFIQGTQSGLEISFDYTQPFAGITKLNSRTTVVCSTPTPTPTQTNTPTNTVTPTHTPTSSLTPTPSSTPSNTPSNTPVTRLRNDCDFITLFDLGISCNVIQSPTDSNPQGGILSLNVTGGTAPYSFTWKGFAQKSQTLFGVPAGDYEVMVTDYDWPDGSPDYTATTICKLAGPLPSLTPTTTPTPTPTSPVQCVDLCLIAIGPAGVPNLGPIQFVCNGTQNGRFKWTGGGYDIIWNVNNSRWQIYISGTTTPVNLGGGILVSTSFELIPDSAWTILGGTVQYSITMTKGNCPSTIPLQIKVNKTNNSCQGSTCNGSISILAENGVSPYLYSIDGGITANVSSNFTNLCPNTYNVVVYDSSDNSQTSIVTIGNDSTPVTYQLSLSNVSPATVITVNNASKTSTQIMKLDVIPPLPVGLSISFDLTATDLITINGPGTGTSSMIWSVSKNNIPVNTTVGPIVPVSQGTRPNCSPNTQTTTSIKYSNSITITNGDVVTITATTVNTITNGQVGTQTTCTTNITDVVSAAILTPVISGNDCSSVIGSPRVVFQNSFTYVPTKIIQKTCVNFELPGGDDGRTYSFTYCDGSDGELTVPQGDSVPACIRLPFVNLFAINNGPCLESSLTITTDANASGVSTIVSMSPTSWTNLTSSDFPVLKTKPVGGICYGYTGSLSITTSVTSPSRIDIMVGNNPAPKYCVGSSNTGTVTFTFPSVVFDSGDEIEIFLKTGQGCQ